MASKRTVQFEFLIDADARQIDKFHDALKRVGDGSATTEKTLTSLRDELQRLNSTSDKTENNLQAQIAALRGASQSADLTRNEYVKLRTEVGLLEREFKDLTIGVVGVGRAYEQAGRQAEAFNRRAAKIAERQRYYAGTAGFATGAIDPLTGSGGRIAPQVGRDASGRLVAPGSLTGPAYAGIGDMGFGQFGPAVSDREWKAVGEFQKAKDRKLELNRQYHQQLLDAELRSNAQIEAAHDAHHRAVLADNQRRHEKELADFDRRLENRTRRREARRRGLGELRGTAASVGAGLFFGGPEGLIGSSLGAGLGLLGGPGGMAAGAALGASAGLAGQQLRMQATMVGDLVAQLNLAKTALAQVSSGQADYNQRLEFARQVSTDYSVGLQATIEGYSKVTAAAAANGLTLKETETIYRGMIASGVAFGASQADLESIIRATTQVLSKGRVSMEEIGQQIGERIPGAVAKFAQATGRSLAQLARDFEQGKVNMQDFVKFTQAQLTDYDAAARIIGDSPEKAGERLQLALTRMGETYGGFFQKIGAEIQDSATAMANWVVSQERNLKTLVGLFSWAGGQIGQALDNAFAGLRFIEQASKFLPGTFIGNAARGPLQDVLGIGAPERAASGTSTGFWADRFREGSSLVPKFTPTRFGEGRGAGSGLSDATAAGDEKAAKKAQAAAEKAQRQREQLESEERRRAELLANNAIRLADRVFEHQQSLIRRRYDLEQELAEATRDAQEAGMTSAARNAQAMVNQILGEVDRYRNTLNDFALRRAADQQAIRSATASANVTAMYGDVPPSAVGRGGAMGFAGGARTGWSRDRDAEQSGFDVTLPGGVGGRVPNPVSSLKITGVGFQGRGRGPSGRGYGNYVTGEFVGIDGKKYEMLLGHFDKVDVQVGDLLARGQTIGRQGETGRTFGTHVTSHVNALNGGDPWVVLRNEVVGPWVRGWGGAMAQAPTRPGVAAGINRNIRDDGQVDIAKANRDATIAEEAVVREKALEILQRRTESIVSRATSSYRDQTQALQDQLQELRERNRLQAEGVKPEIIDQQIELSRLTLEQSRTVETLQAALRSLGERTEENKVAYDKFAEGIAKVNDGYKGQIAAQQELNALTNQRPEFNLRNSLRSGIDGYIESIGTLDEAVQGLAQSGFGGLSDAISDLATTGTADFKAFAMSALADMAQVIFQQMVVANLMQAIKGLFGGGGSAIAGKGVGGLEGVLGNQDFLKYAGPSGLAKGGVMTEHGPLKALPYARGGIASTSQVAVFGEGSMPEAFVPLPDGRRIPVNLQLPFQRQAGAADAAEASPLTLPYAKGGGGGVAVIGDDKPLRIESGGIRPDELPFVTYEQHQRGMAQAAAAGEARTLARIRNNPAVRRRAGM